MNQVIGLFVLFFVSSGFAESQPNNTCINVFDVSKVTTIKAVQDYLNEVTNEQNPQILPQFLNREQEIANSKSWKGVAKIPRLIEQALPQGFTPISHQLYQAQPGVVKNDGAGLFVSGRAEVQFKGDVIGTNAGVTSSALVSNLISDKKYLARKDARAIILFMHGGGSKGTGHHVANNITNYMNSYGIDVVSIDNPWHAEGPRHVFKNMDEYIDYLIEFTHKFLPPNVPIFIAGHSLGGMYADMILRRSDKNPKIKQTFAGAIPLSPVGDLAPGQSFQQKALVEKSRNQELLPGGELFQQLSEEDKFFGEMIVADGKISPIAWFEIQNMMVDNDWTMPAHQGEEYIPSLYIMGKGDGLYVGLKDHFETHVANLKKSKLVLFGRGVSFRGEEYLVGHLIFDNIDSNKDPEAFVNIREFIFDVTNQSNRTQIKSASSNLDNFQTIIANYMNNFVFRKFISEFYVDRKIPNSRITSSIDQYLQSLQKYVSEANALIKKNKSINQNEINQSITLPQNVKDLQHAQAEIKRIISIKSDNYIPNDERGPLAESLIKKREEIQKVLSELGRQKSQKKKALNELVNSRRRSEKALFSYFNIYLKQSRGVSLEEREFKLLSEFSPSPRLKHSVAVLNEELENLKQALFNLNQSGHEYLSYLVETNNRTSENLLNLPPKLQHLFNQYMSIEKEYLELVKKTKNLFVEECRDGEMGEHLRVLSISLYDPLTGLNAQVEGASKEMSDMESMLQRLYEERTNVIEEYINKISYDYFEFRRTPFVDILNSPYETAKDNIGLIQKMLSEWVMLWGEKPPAESTSLY